MDIRTIPKEDGTTEQVIITSTHELTTVMQLIIIYQVEGQVNIHIEENGDVRISKPVYKN